MSDAGVTIVSANAGDLLAEIGGAFGRSPLSAALRRAAYREPAGVLVSSLETLSEGLGGRFAIGRVADRVASILYPTVLRPSVVRGEREATVEEILGLSAGPYAEPARPPVRKIARAPRPVSGNATARWIASRYAEVFAELCRTVEKRFQRSSTLGVVEDHVSTFLARLIEKDTLAPHLEQGLTIKISVLRVWVFQSVSSELRKWGTDANLRTSCGARTARENADPKAAVIVSEAPMRRVLLSTDEGSLDRAEDYVNPYEGNAEERVSYEQAVRRGRDLVRSKLTAEHLAAYDALLEGADRRGLREEYGKRGRTILKELREVLASEF